MLEVTENNHAGPKHLGLQSSIFLYIKRWAFHFHLTNKIPRRQARNYDGPIAI